MSVFHTMCLGTNYDFNHMKKMITDFESIKCFNIKENAEVFTLCSEGLTIFIKEGGQGLLFKNEDYGLNFKFDIYIDINGNFKGWAQMLMEFSGEIIRNFDGDFILEANGDSLYIMRKKVDGVVIVDDTHLESFPFDSLGLEFKKEKLEQV